MIQDIINMGDDEREQLTDDQIEDMVYAIKYVNYDALVDDEHDYNMISRIMGELKTRVAELESQPEPELEPQPMVMCDCGHEVHESQVMSASRGTSCSYCYDRMSA